jgi:predicted amidohydrolase YtcJ
MAHVTRKEFLSLSALVAGAAALPRFAFGRGMPGVDSPPSAQTKGFGIVADLIVVNARVLTSDSTAARAQAFAVRDGKFLAVGTSADIRNLAGKGTRIVDAKGMTVTPGFIDAHCHPSGVGELYSADANVKTKALLQENLRKRAAQTPAGFWVEGFMFDDTKLTDATPLDRRDLDAVSTQHPIYVAHRGGHTAWFNSKALELAGITRDTPDPQHGRYFRDANGDLTGRVAELAVEKVLAAGMREKFTPEQERERARAGMSHISKLLTAAGLTTVHDLSAVVDNIRAYEEIRANGELRHRAYMMIRGDAFPKLRDAGVYTGFGDEWIRVGGVKFAADGSASERTMRMSTPYVGTQDYGILTMTQQEIHDAVEDAHRHGWQVGIHANGDVTIDMVLQAYERVLTKWPHPDRRHRIEHCTLVTPELLKRIKATGSIPTPFWTYVYFHGEKWSNYGDEKLSRMFAHRSFLDYGIVVPGASDYNPGPFEPLMAIQSMVTRRDYRGREWGPNQKVSVDEALRIATLNGAHASYEEKVKGSITAGKLADFVMLEKDPHEVDANTIKDIRIASTYVGGKEMYSA